MSCLTGRVSCLPLPPPCSFGRGQTKKGESREGESQMKMLLKIGQHPAHPCSRPPPIFSATSARPPLRGAGGLGARGARCGSADGGGIWDTRVPGGAAQGKSCHSTARHHIGGRAVPSQDEHVYKAVPHGLYYLIFPANARKQFTIRSLTKTTTARTPGAAAKL